LRRVFLLLLASVVFGTGAASLLSLWAAESWLADLAVNFRVQYLAIGLLATPWFAWRRHWPLVATASVAVALNVGPVVTAFSLPTAASPAETVAEDAAAVDSEAPVAAIAPGSAATPVAVRLRIASANLFFLNHSHAAVITWARATQPEVLLFLEATAEWRGALAPLAAEYPHRRYVTDRSHHGLLLLSRWPISDVLTRPTAQQDLRPVLFTTITKQGVPLRLAAMHATWPLRPRDARQRARDLAALAAEAARRGSLPFMGLGDLNISPFSPHFQALLRDGGLRSASAGRGWQPTWPAIFPPLGIQIDHALVSPDVQVQAFRRGTANGSDHRPIVIDVIIPNGNAVPDHP
jgi:endonuclease/exonuclease/phosphatase family metal-dependent hydrolase